MKKTTTSFGSFLHFLHWQDEEESLLEGSLCSINFQECFEKVLEHCDGELSPQLSPHFGCLVVRAVSCGYCDFLGRSLVVSLK